MGRPLVIWCVTDNKPGHRSQMQGLVNALQALMSVKVTWIDRKRGLGFSPRISGERPSVILAAGHRTHIPSLWLRSRYGGRLVVLMKPSLPRALFDLCVIPEHDGVEDSRKVVTTRGMLNDILPSHSSRDGCGLIMIGGEAKAYAWSDVDMLARVRQLLAILPDYRWTLTTSRRTPASFIAAVGDLRSQRLQVVPFEQTDRGWLRRQYEFADAIWVSEDSASMVYEALSATGRVGILEVPRLRTGRVARGLDRLVDEGLVTNTTAVARTGCMPGGASHLSEAARVSQYLQHWLHTGVSATDDENSASIT